MPVDWDKYLTENRAMIDELLGPNRDEYAQISLKGQIVSEIGKFEAFKYFEHWERMGLTSIQKNVQMRLILDSIRQRGIDISLITPEDKVIYIKTLMREFSLF